MIVSTSFLWRGVDSLTWRAARKGSRGDFLEFSLGAPLEIDPHSEVPFN